MRLLKLSMMNVGPFDEAELEFLSSPDEPVPVALITGENGAGKSIIIDAIRAMFGPNYTPIERRLWRPDGPFRAELTASIDGKLHTHASTGYGHANTFGGSHWFIHDVPGHAANSPRECPNWVVDFWRSKVPNDPFEIAALVNRDHRRFLFGSLQGALRNAEVTELICHFDYLRDSRDPRERQTGEILFETTRKIIQASLLDGELTHVARATFTPMVKQSGQVVPLANLSSGNAYSIQRMISLLGKMYAVHVLRESDPSDICKTPGLLLIDEAENHLHPRWQKRFIRGILEVFPNLQIIATTHSPFLLASVPRARVFVCRYNGTTCTVSEESDSYANKPVEEILLSSAFDETQPWSEEISALLAARKKAIQEGDAEKRSGIEKILKERNPEYFAYFDVEERLASLRGAAQ